MLWQYIAKVDSLLLRGESIALRTDFVEFSIDVLGGSRGRAFKTHMLKKMADAGQFDRFVSSTGAHEKSEAGGYRIRIAFGNKL